MAGTFKPKNGQGKESPFWHASFYVSDLTGRRVLVKRSTKFTDRRKAQAAAVEMERAGRKAGERNLTQAAALEIVDRVLELATGERLQKHTLSGALHSWLETKKANAAGATFDKYNRAVEGFLAFMGKDANLPLESVGAIHLAKFQQSERASGKSGHTVNCALRTLAQAFGSWHRHGLIRDNPAGPIKPLSSDVESRLPFTAEELHALLKAAQRDDEWYGAIMVGAYTGMRIGDVCALRWANVDPQEKVIHLRPQKTRKATKTRSLTIPILPPLEDWLLSRTSTDNPEAKLFPRLAKAGLKGSTGLSGQFGKIMRQAGIKAGLAREKAGDKGRNVSQKSFHSLRHGFNTWMANAGVSQEIRQKIMGHSTASMNDTYTRLESATLRAALSEMPIVNPLPS